MESIEAKVLSLKSELEGIVRGGDLSVYTVKDINKIIAYKDRICGGSWEENIQSTKTVKQRYLDCEGVNITRKIEAILTWKSDYWGKSIDLNGFMGEILRHLGEGLGYDTVWDLLKKGKLAFGKNDVGGLPKGFIEYVCKRKVVRKGSDVVRKKGVVEGSDSEEDEGEGGLKHINFGPVEKFLINLLMFEYEDGSNIKIMKMLTEACDPRMNFLPQKVTRFNGELMSQIIPHYKANFISPVIDCRRGVGVILENQRRQFYEYEQFVKNNGRFLATQITVELPYMCYGYIKEVEIDLLDVHGCGGESLPKMYISTGTEYVVYPFQECKKWEKGHFDSCTTLRQDVVEGEGGEMPCTYISIHFGFTGTLFPSIQAVRLYGDAVSFI
jgi:hypothetical protein